MKKTADALVFTGSGNELKILLIQRKHPPFQNVWAFPGGFLADGEHPLAACLRELKEETSLELKGFDGVELATRKLEGRDPRGQTKTYPFMFYLEEKSEVVGQDDAIKAEWVKLTDLAELAFDHGAILCEALGHFWKFMPSFSVKLDGIDLPDFMWAPDVEDNLEGGVFYGGSFNPWHDGHTACVEGAPAKTIIVPDANPWKQEDVKELECCWKSFKKICNHVANHDVYVYPGFWGAEQGNPTISWLAKSHFKKYSLVMGDDSFLSLHKWQDAHELINLLTNLYVIPRAAEKSALDAQKAVILGINVNLNIRFGEHHSFENISSTDLRNS